MKVVIVDRLYNKVVQHIVVANINNFVPESVVEEPELSIRV